MRDLDPFAASILNVWAQVPEAMADVRSELLGLLEAEGTPESREIVRPILSPEAKLSEITESVPEAAVASRG
jgi:hypothetical protein